jgi:transposase-like protein
MEAEQKAAPIKVTRKRQYYDAAYKRNAVELAVREGYSVRAAAAVFNVSAAEYYRWRREYGPASSAAAKGSKTLAEVEAENLRLRLELRRMREREDVLKKSLGILSETPTSGLPKLKR